MSEQSYRVRAVACDHLAKDEEIYLALKKATDPLDKSWERLRRARKVVIKFNMMKLPESLYYYGGRRRELVDDAVCHAVLRLIRERTDAEIIATDTNVYRSDKLCGDDFNYAGILKAHGVGFVDANLPPFSSYTVPGGGAIFDRYTLTSCMEGAEVVSVAKLKNHKFMGITLCTKNLFGLPPTRPPEGRTRSYYHHLVRLPYVLTDLAMITNPCLNIIDALTGQWGAEWGGEGRIGDALIAGDHPIATDACGAHLMGHDPTSDWPVGPFYRDRNHLLVATERGYGTVDLEEIDYESEVVAPLSDFDAIQTDPPEMVATWLGTTCVQGKHYQANQEELVGQYANRFIFLQDGEVVWSGTDTTDLKSRRNISGTRKEQALWLKLVDPNEIEGERFAVYSEHPAASG